jgi:hypothetical protein
MSKITYVEPDSNMSPTKFYDFFIPRTADNQPTTLCKTKCTITFPDILHYSIT